MLNKNWYSSYRFWKR